MNPIIKYLASGGDTVIPEKLFDELQPILKDPDVVYYLTAMSAPCLAPHASSDEFLPTLKAFSLAALALGYMYGKEGDKTPEDIVKELFKEKNIKLQEE